MATQEPHLGNINTIPNSDFLFQFSSSRATKKSIACEELTEHGSIEFHCFIINIQLCVWRLIEFPFECKTKAHVRDEVCEVQYATNLVPDSYLDIAQHFL